MPIASESSARSLGVVQETLLIPLAARAAAASSYPHLRFRDVVAEAVIADLDVDTARFLADRPSMVGSILRAQWFDRVAMDFIARRGDALCVNLGAGLDARAQRIGASDKPGVDWVDIDLPDVVRLRETALPACDGVCTLAADITDRGWIDALPWPPGRPALFMAEGVMMYLEPSAAETLVAAICAAADARSAEIELVLDHASPLMVRFGRKHPSVAMTKAHFLWALARPDDLRRIDPRLIVVERNDIMPRSGVVPALMWAAHLLATGGRHFYGMARLRRSPAP